MWCLCYTVLTTLVWEWLQPIAVREFYSSTITIIFVLHPGQVATLDVSENSGDAKHSTVFSSFLHRHLNPSNSLLLLMVPVPAFKNPFIYLCVCLWMFKGIADDETHICSHCTTLTMTTVLVSSAFDMPATKSFCSYCVFEIDMRVWYPDCLADEKVSLDVGKLIQQSRMGKKLTQKDLATVRALWKL